MIAKAIKKDKYILSTVIISLAVAVLIHFPESVSLFDRFESHSLFPGMKFIDVANEILFTFLSLLLLFAINTRLFHFNQASIKITGTKILLSFIVTWILSNLSGQFFVFLHRTFDIPAGISNVLWRKTKNCPDKLLNIHVTIKESKIFVPVILMEAWLKWNKRVLMAKSNNSDRKVNRISFATSINFIPGNKEWLSKRSKRDTDSGKWISTATAKEMMTVESIYLSFFIALAIIQQR